jgi:phosphopantetheinyl transferase
MEEQLAPYRVPVSMGVDLWGVPVNAMDPLLLEAWLPSEERARLPVHPANRLRSLVGRALVRGILAERLGKSPESFTLSHGRQGKPYLSEQPWHFNLAHSGDYVLFAVAQQPLGVDLEQVVPARFRPTLLERIATSQELAWVGRDVQRFFRLWCAKEACLKRLGVGIAQLSRVCLQLDGDIFIATVDGHTLEGQWLTFAENYIGAVCI